MRSTSRVLGMPLIAWSAAIGCGPAPELSPSGAAGSLGIAVGNGGGVPTGNVGIGGALGSDGGGMSDFAGRGGMVGVAGTTGSSAGVSATGSGGSAGAVTGSVPVLGSAGTAAGGGSGTAGANAGGDTDTGGSAGSDLTGGGAGGTTSIGGGNGGETTAGGAAGAAGAGSGDNPALCPPGVTQTLTVAADGSGQFTTVQAAVDSLASGSAEHVRIDIQAGTYTEKITIDGPKNLCLVGADASSTILSYDDSNAQVGSTSGSASVLIDADDFSAANLTIQNTYGVGSQAVALRTTGQRQQFLNCRFVGHQDTLYTHQGSQYFRNCYVQGNTDYVFGGATAVLENCEVRNVEGGSAVAAPNTDVGAAYGIVFLGGRFTADAGVRENSVALGRPWGANGAGAYLGVDLGAHIIAGGFVEMSGNQPQNARFHEYQSVGTGSDTASRSSYQLTESQAASYTVETIFNGWIPSYSE